VICVKSSYVRYGVPERKFLKNEIFSPPGVDTERYMPANEVGDKFIVLHVSSISIIKGIQYLLVAWELIVDDINGKMLLVGPIDQNMRAILKSKKWRNVEWVGKTDDPISYYRKASVFVSPSISNAGPRTVLEAMAYEVPAIVSDNCGVSESIENGVDGLVYKYDDVERLADHLKWSFNNRDKLREMGKEARKKVMSYRIDYYFDSVFKRIMQVETQELEK